MPFNPSLTPTAVQASSAHTFAMKQLLVFSLFLSLSIQAAWTVKPAANPKAPGQGLAIAEDGKPVAHFVFGEGQESKSEIKGSNGWRLASLARNYFRISETEI